MSCATGNLLGPFVGGYFYRNFGFEAPFLLLSSLFFAYIPLFYFTVPSIIDKNLPDFE
jgi:hypothetical protein